MAFQFTTIVGRLVYGSVWEARPQTDKKGQPTLVKSGPNAGKQKVSCNFGVAFAKTLANGAPNVAFDEWRRAIIEQARTGYPQFFNGPIDPFTGKPGCTHPRMTFKISDGDGVDGEGQPNNRKEGWAGHWVVHFSSNTPPRVFDVNVGLLPEQQLQESSGRVLPGDFIAVQGNCEANVGSETPGVYMNHSMVCFVATGPRIVSGPKASEAFANVTAAGLPPGCVPGATPATVAPLPPASGGVPAPAVPSVPAGASTVPPAPGIVPPVAPVAHDPKTKALADGWLAHPQAPGYMYKGNDIKTDAEVLALYPAPAPVVPAIPVPPTPPVPPMPPAAAAIPSGPTLTPAALAAGFTTYAAAIANGWNDDMLRQHGYLV
jgi:hypothetical protein